MAVDTVSEQIKDMLENNWSLLGDLAVANVHFDVGWYDSRWNTRPQVTVRHAVSPPHRVFGANVEGGHVDLHLMSFERYVVNCWVEIRPDSVGDSNEDDIEEMRREVVRIINNQWKSFPPPLGMVVPLDMGRPLHEWNRTPRLLRYEITLQATYHV